MTAETNPEYVKKRCYFTTWCIIDILNQLCHPFSRIRAIEKGKVTQLIHYTYIADITCLFCQPNEAESFLQINFVDSKQSRINKLLQSYNMYYQSLNMGI